MNAVNAAGWYDAARRVDAHGGRIGGKITPWSVVVHTTDCMPGSMPGIVQRWSTTGGAGDCAHFVIGRGPADGVVQMIPITRNANHAGGMHLVAGKWVQWHGNFHVGGADVHPNTVTVGIELDCAGYLGKPGFGGAWRHKDSGLVVPPADVYTDARGNGWHIVTQYQYAQLDALLGALEHVLAAPPAGASVAPSGTYKDNGVLWAAMPGVRHVGHVTLDPNNKTDPGPQVLDWLRSRTP